MAHVLIGFAEALSAAETVFSLRAAGHQVSAFTRKGCTAPILKHLRLNRVIRLTPPEDDADAAIADLRAGIDKISTAPTLLPLDDFSVWICQAAASQQGRAVPVAGATGTQAEAALDKAIQIEAAQKAGLTVPETRILTTPDDVSTLAETLEPAIPRIAKPARAVVSHAGRLDKGSAVYLITRDDAAALTHQYDPRSSGPLIVQPLIRGTGIGVFGLATSAGVVAWSGHERLRMMNPHGSGSSACRSRIPDPDLQSRISDFLTLMNWRGPFMVELLEDADGTPWFMELNGRMWGSLALARRQGMEYPAWAVALSHTPECRPPEIAARNGMTVRHLGRDLVHLAFAARGPQSAFHKPGWPSPWSGLARVLCPAPAHQFYNYDPASPWYFLRDAGHTVWQTLQRRR